MISFDYILDTLARLLERARTALTKIKVGDFVVYENEIYEVLEIKDSWLVVTNIKKRIIITQMLPPHIVLKLKNRNLINILYKD